MKRKVKFLCGATVMVALGAGLSLLIPSFNSIAKGIANSDCDWRHYAKVEATSYENGCNEYWVCCQHHEIVFEEPTAGTIQEATHEEGFLKTLQPSDKRFITAKANVVSDASTVEFNWHDYPLATGTFTPKVDPVIGNYVECSNLTNTNDAVWIAPKNLPNANLLKTCTKIYFWVRSTNNQSLEIRDFDYVPKQYSSVNANEWKYFEVDPTALGGNGVGVSHWAAHSEPINFDISSFYCERNGVVTLMDVKTSVFKGINSSTSDRSYPAAQDQGGNATYTANCSDGSMISPYSKAVGINRSGDQINISPEARVNISVYSTVFFWVRINGGTSSVNISLRSGIYTTVSTICAADSTSWSLVVITPGDGQLSDLQYFGIGNWGTFTDLELDFSSVFAYNAGTYDTLYSSATDYWINFDAAADPEGERQVNLSDDSFIKPYSSITGITRAGGQEKFNPAPATDISDYDFIFFWVRANQDLTGMKVLNFDDGYDDSKAIVSIASMPANTWVQVFIDVSDITTRELNKIVFGKWGTFEGVRLDFGSIFGVAEE